MRLGQAHGAGPLARSQFVQVGGFLGIGAVLMQTGIGPVRQAGVHGPGLIGRIEHFIKTLVDHIRQGLATKLRVGAERRPAAFNVFLIGLFEALWRRNFVAAAVQRATFLVTRNVQRENDFRSEFTALFKHCVDGVDVGLCMFGKGFEFFANVQQLMQHKLKIPLGWVVGGHKYL